MRRSILREFIEINDRVPTHAKPPIVPARAQTPIVPVDRWKIDNKDELSKTFRFMRDEDRTSFVASLLSYENKVKHNAVITVREGEVHISVSTKGVDVVTELDKEYASYRDGLFREISRQT